METSCLECIFILVDGLAFFPNEALTLGAYHAELMCISVCNPEMSLSQSVLAFTIQGLSSACLGGPFFGSPFLVLRWLDEHILLPTLDAGLPLEEYIHRFCTCEVKPQIDSFGHLSTFRMAYDPQRCFSMLGQKKGVPPRLSSIPCIQTQERGSPTDATMVYYIRALWATLDRHDDSDGSHSTPLTYCLLWEDEHWNWYSKLLPRPKEWVEETGVLRKKRKRPIS